MLLIFLFNVARTHAQRAAAEPEKPAPAARLRVSKLDFLGKIVLPVGTPFEGTPVGGLSGITYDAARSRYYAISDDRSERAPARFYTLSIDVADGHLDDGDVRVVGVTTLLDAAGATFPKRSLDPEGIALSASGSSVFVSSEGDSSAGIAPFVREFALDAGKQRLDLPIPDHFLPAKRRGVRNTQGFESLALSPDGKTLVTATECALAQDGPESSATDASPCRLLFFDVATGKPVREAIYVLEPATHAKAPPGAGVQTGLSELIALDDHGTLLSLERSYAPGFGVRSVVYEVRTEGARDVLGVDSLLAAQRPPTDGAVEKRKLLDVEPDTGVRPDNLEAMTFGPTMKDGRRLLILASDDNFSMLQTTQFLAFAATVEKAP